MVGAEDFHAATVGSVTWMGDRAQGMGPFTFWNGSEQVEWTFVDYRDQITPSEETAAALGMEPGEPEERNA